MREQLTAYLEAVQAGENQSTLCEEIGKFLLSCNTKFFVDNRHDVAELFYQYLCALQRIYGNETASIMGEQVEKVFRAVAQINTNEETIDEEDSNLMTVRFLSQLYSGEQEEYGNPVEELMLLKAISILLEGLEDIYFIFHIERDGEVLFPINRLITKVIKSPDFISIEKISTYHVRILQLAVELFQNTDEKEVIDELRHRCHLKFLDYLNGAQNIIDTKDMKNYQTNGVMIFHNSNWNRVLIRHERKEYFQNVSLENLCGKGIEVNWHNEEIGYYQEYDLEDGSLTDYHEMIRVQPVEFLKLIYDKSFYNIFLNKMIVKKTDGTFQVLNPFCINDKKIIQEKFGTNESGRIYNKDQINVFLTEYRWKCVQGKMINRVTLGLCQNLLNQDNIGTDLLLQENDDEDWMQNQVIRNWIINGRMPKDNLMYVLKMWLEELEYCASKKEIESHKVVQGDLYPLTLSLNWIYEVLGLSEDCGILYGEIQSSFDGERRFCVEVLHTVAGGRYFRDQLPIMIPAEEIEWSDETDKDVALQDGMPHYLSYNFQTREWFGGFDEEEYYKLLARIEQIQVQGSLKYEIAKVVQQPQFDKIQELMKLHEGALLAKKDIFSDFESMVVYRLIHNLLWSGITPDKWEKYYYIFHNHQILSFENIETDERFGISDSKTLYVPKDNAEQDAVLYRICERYLDKESGTRHKTQYLYNHYIGQNESGEYLINGNKIERMVFLFDNFEYGSSTKNVLALYLGHEEKLPAEWSEDKIDKHKQSLQKYICDDAVVQVKDICKGNQITDIAVYAYYGTEDAKENIKDFLNDCGFENVDVDYKKLIYQKTSRVKDEWKQIWKNKSAHEKRRWVGDDVFLVVREFSLTKKNVFPDEMITEPERAIVMFVKKPE